MGIIDFVKEAGEKIGLGKRQGDDEEAVQEYIEEQTKANALWHHVTDLGIGIEELEVTFDDGVATVRGKTDSRSEKEKAVLAIGNTVGVLRVDDRIEVEDPAPAATFYTVQKGDTLSKIALEHYGKANAYPRIFEANRPMLEDPDRIYPGQVLRIPPKE